tara:strand:- start:179 stop:373 length:195 start_codon:yes stop_codon:yes gene_type:complete
MWLAVLLTCSGPIATTCDVLVRTGGMLESQEECRKEVQAIAVELAKDGFYIRGECYKLKIGSKV